MMIIPPFEIAEAMHAAQPTGELFD